MSLRLGWYGRERGGEGRRSARNRKSAYFCGERCWGAPKMAGVLVGQGFTESALQIFTRQGKPISHTSGCRPYRMGASSVT